MSHDVLNGNFHFPSTVCFICKMEREALEHVFLKCPPIVQTWSLAPWPLQRLEFECSGLDKGYSRIGYKNGISSKGKDGVPIVTCCGERKTKLEWGRHPELG